MEIHYENGAGFAMCDGVTLDLKGRMGDVEALHLGPTQGEVQMKGEARRPLTAVEYKSFIARLAQCASDAWDAYEGHSTLVVVFGK
jgi:hypothetical protein